jgi:pyruvate,water dikinase
VLDDTGGEPWRRKAMRGDEIIVARSANLGLAPLMRMAAGLVVEVGGVLAHAACQARESGIPAVVLAGATSILREGMAISIDGATGRIELLEERTAS